MADSRENIVIAGTLAEVITNTPSGIEVSLVREKLHRLVFELCAETVSSFILSHHGNSQDTEDALHDIYLLFSGQKWHKKLLDDALYPNYIITTGRNLWLKEMARREAFVGLQQDFLYCDFEQEKEQFENQNKRYNLFRNVLIRMTFENRKIILAVLKKIPGNYMAERLGYSEENYKKRRSRCLKTLISRIHLDPRYKELKADQVPNCS
jgi:hypothetical protein